jgi:hypothetical protein
VNVESSNYVPYKSKTAVESGGPLEFAIPSSIDNVDFSKSYLDLVVSIKKANGDALKLGTGANDDRVPPEFAAPTNYFLHTMFKNVELHVGGKLISDTSNTYPYRSYLEAILHYGSDAKRSHLQEALYYKDTAGAMDALDGNSGLEERFNFSKGSAKFQLKGRLHLDMMQQSKVLMDHTEIKLRLIRSDPTFCLMTNNIDCKVVIEDATLYVCKHKPYPTVWNSILKEAQNTNVKYGIKQTLVKTYQASQGDYQISKDDIFLGKRPDVLVWGMVDSAAFNGDYKKNPFNFEHCDMKSASVTLNGQPAAVQNYNFAMPEQYLDGYHSLFEGSSIGFENSGLA